MFRISNINRRVGLGTYRVDDVLPLPMETLVHVMYIYKVMQEESEMECQSTRLLSPGAALLVLVWLLHAGQTFASCMCRSVRPASTESTQTIEAQGLSICE